MIFAPILNWCSGYCAIHIHIWYLQQLCSNCAVANIISHISSLPKPTRWQIADDKEFCNGNYGIECAINVAHILQITCNQNTNVAQKYFALVQHFPRIIIKFGPLWANIMTEIIPNHFLKYCRSVYIVLCMFALFILVMPNSLKMGMTINGLIFKMRIPMKALSLY